MGHKSHVAAVTNNGKQVVSADSSATVMVVGTHGEGVCHVAALSLVAVRTCPEVGAVAELTLTVVVADFKAFVAVASVAVSAFQVNAPMNVVVDRAFVVALYVSPASVAGDRLPVAAVPNRGNVVVSPPASATVTVAALPDIFVWSPVLLPLIVAVPVTVRSGVEAPDIATELYLPAVISPVVSAIVTAEF